MKYPPNLTVQRKLPQGLHNSSRPFSPPSFTPIEVVWGTLLLHRLRHCPTAWADRIGGYGRLAGERGYPPGFIASFFCLQIVVGRVLNTAVQRRLYTIQIPRPMTLNLCSSFISCTYNPATFTVLKPLSY